MKICSLRSYERAAIRALDAYYEARMWARQHPKSAKLREVALAARHKSRDALAALLAEETKVGMRGFPK